MSFRFAEYKKSFLLKNHKKFAWGFRFLKHKNSFLLKKCKKFFNIRARKFHFLKYKKFFRDDFFFVCFELGSKSALGSCIIYY